MNEEDHRKIACGIVWPEHIGRDTILEINNKFSACHSWRRSVLLQLLDFSTKLFDSEILQWWPGSRHIGKGLIERVEVDR